jgi:hypothetical protein
MVVAALNWRLDIRRLSGLLLLPAILLTDFVSFVKSAASTVLVISGDDPFPSEKTQSSPKRNGATVH